MDKKIEFISGGALGSDSVWSFYGDQHEVTTYHLIAEGMTRPTGGKNSARNAEQQSGEVRIVPRERLIEAIEALIEMNISINGKDPNLFFNGYKLGLSPAQKLHARNYWQVMCGEQVLAIAPIQDDRCVHGGTATACNLGIALGKPVYVLNILDCSWYKWSKTKKKFIKSTKPKFKANNTVIGTRTLVKYETYKGGSWKVAPYVGAEVEQQIREMIQDLF